ncbi:hypothetical protein JYU34_004299 [Plutella xylostella]|uniref:Epg5-like TPR domain-containing protein n=1 Tax=Plutella xylostella TaxID=51655 RepID=A0ABQ7QXM1_PLUXY|nr:hypothetical protein JYU34_004299 [Plutella xylostella]
MPLLMQIDTTPYSGVSLQSQLDIGLWLTAWAGGASHEPRWRALRRLKLHRVWWGYPHVHHHVDDPPPFTPAADKDNNTLFLETYYLLATAWGHSVPVICTHGVEVLHRLASAGRARDVTHCLSAILVIMTQSPESISLTPKFVEVFSLLAGSAPSLIQRALGRGAEPGANMLLKLMTTQLAHASTVANVSVSSVLSVWLHSLWSTSGSLLQAAMLACPLTAQLDQHCAAMEESNPGSVTAALSPHHPPLCASALRTRHGDEARALWPRVLSALHAQRVRGESAHVDNALKSIGAQMTSDELVIHKTAAAVLAAPLSSSAYLELWMLFFSLYLQRPPEDPRDTTAPIGPLFFSGFIKSRVLAQLKKKLQEVITYHYTESERLKNEQKLLTIQPETTHTERVVKSSKPDLDLLPPLKLVDLTGESDESSESSDSEEEKMEDIEVNVGEGDRQLQNLITYHVAAETISRTYLSWLEEGDKVRAMPHMLRHIPDQALAAARKAELSKLMPPSSPDDEDMVPIAGDPRPLVVPKTPFERVVAMLKTYPVRGMRRRRRMSIKSPIEDAKVESPRHSVSLTDKHLRDIERLAQEWESEVSRVSKLDSALWELVTTLRVRRPIAPVPKSCPNKCKPITLVVPAHEWCISTGSERSIRDNRTGARNALRRLARPRPNAAKTAAALQTITRQVTSADTAMVIMERAWLCGRDARAAACAPARLALTSIVTDLAEVMSYSPFTRQSSF